ncbi:unnamed protein product [Calypogeia fissa]
MSADIDSDSGISKESRIVSTGGSFWTAVSQKRFKMTVQNQCSGVRSDHGEEESAMADKRRVEAEELPVEGVQGAALPINLERILSAGTMKEWWNLLPASDGPDLSRLHWDILGFCKAHELTPHQIQLRKDALACVERAVHEIWPIAETFLFGSTATGLALPWSDIDVVIMPPKHLGPAWRKPTPMSWQNALGRKLNALGQCRSLQKIPFAKVPLLKVVFNSGVACDITFDVRNSHAGVSVVRHFVKQYEACRPLCLLLKFFLGQNNLNELHIGGLGSFCIITMVVSHLQNTASIVETGLGDLGTLLLSFFAYYSNMHNYSTDVVSTRPGFCGSKQDKGWVNQKNPQLLAVEDPLDPTSDIGKGSYRIEQIRHKFWEAQRSLLAHWDDEQVLAQIVDTTSNPNQKPAAPSPEKIKTSKRMARKKRRTTTGQNEYILTQQPALKIPWRHHPQQGSGLVTKSQLDLIMANARGRHFTSSLPSNRFTSGHDEEKFCSVQNVVAPASQQRISWRTQGNAGGCNAGGCNSLEANSSPEMRPRESGLQHQVAADLSRAQENKWKGSSSTQPNDFPSRKKPRTTLNHQIAENDCRPIPSVHCHLRSDGMDALGSRENQDEEINFEFWESQLMTRSKPRKISLKRGENPGQRRELSHTHGSSRGSGFLGTISTPIIRPTRKGTKHLTTEENCPTQSGHFHLSQEALDVPAIRGNQDERKLLDFWESHIATGSKPRKAYPGLSGVGLNDSPAGAAKQNLHHELPHKISEMQLSAQDEKLFQDRGTGGNKEEAQTERAQYGNPISSKTQDVNSVENCSTDSKTKAPKVQPTPQDERRCVSGGSAELAQAVEFSHPEQFPNGGAVQSKTQHGKPVEHRGTGGSNECTRAVETIRPERSLNGSKTRPSGQDAMLVVDLDFWENQLTTKRKSKPVSPPTHRSSRGLGKEVQPTVAFHSEQCAQGKDVAGGIQDNGIAEEILDPKLTSARKSRSDSLQPYDLGDKTDQPEPALGIHHEQPSQGRDLAQEFEKQGLSLDFWEAQLGLRPMSQKGASENQHTSRDVMEDSPRLTSAKSSCVDDGSGEHVGVLPKQSNHLDRPERDRDVSGGSGGKIVEYLEAQLAARLKGGNCSLEQLAAGCEDEDARRKRKRRLEQQQNPQSREVLEINPDEKRLVDFWETHLNPKTRAKNGPLNDQQETGGVDEALEMNPDERKLVEFWETHLSLKPRSSEGPLDDQLAAGGGDKVEDAEKSKGHGYDRILVDFWEANLTPSLKSRKCAVTNDGLALDDDTQSVQKSHLEGRARVGRSEDEAILSTFWEAYLNPAFPRKCYLRRKSTAVV